MEYEAFLESRYHERGDGFETDNLPPQLFDFQRYLVQWALKRGRAAIFADCGLDMADHGGLKYAHATNQAKGHSSMCVVRRVRDSLPIAVPTRSAGLLLSRLPVAGSQTREHGLLHSLRRGGVPQVRRAGPTQEGAPVLFEAVPHAVQGDQPQGERLPEARPRSRSPHRGGVRARQAAPAGRGRTPHRREQAQQRAGESGGVPVAVSARALPPRADVGIRVEEVRATLFDSVTD